MEQTSSVNTDFIYERAEELVLLALENPEAHRANYEFWNTLAKNLENQGWKKMTGKTQHDKIIAHLKKAGSITVREAMIDYSIQSLTKRVQELREMGYPIVSTVKHHPVTQQKYTRYSLAA